MIVLIVLAAVVTVFLIVVAFANWYALHTAKGDQEAGRPASLNIRLYRFVNWTRKVYVRILHPWPFYKKVGGIDAVVIRADGTRENLGKVSPVYGKRWGVGSGQE